MPRANKGRMAAARAGAGNTGGNTGEGAGATSLLVEAEPELEPGDLGDGEVEDFETEPAPVAKAPAKGKAAKPEAEPDAEAEPFPTRWVHTKSPDFVFQLRPEKIDQRSGDQIEAALMLEFTPWMAGRDEEGKLNPAVGMCDLTQHHMVANELMTAQQLAGMLVNRMTKGANGRQLKGGLDLIPFDEWEAMHAEDQDLTRKRRQIEERRAELRAGRAGGARMKKHGIRPPQ